MDTKIWIEESDNYTKRAINLHGKELYNTADRIESSKELFDNISKFIKSPKYILDVGCAFGASIESLKDRFKEASFFGIDPGKESILIANKNLANDNISFINGFSHELPYENDKFDVVIFSMVFQWIPRRFLIQTISEVDRVLKVGGIVYIEEFLTNKPVTSQSKHDKEIYIFKDDYAKNFTSFPWYKEVLREIKQLEEGEDYQRNISIVRKYSISEVYTLKQGVTEKK